MLAELVAGGHVTAFHRGAVAFEQRGQRRRVGAVGDVLPAGDDEDRGFGEIGGGHAVKHRHGAQQGGAVALDSIPGQGTTITLFLPRVVSAEDGPSASPSAPAAPVGADIASVDILVVEDDPRVLGATVRALRELGHRPIPCDDPLAAPALLATHKSIGLILADVLMPERTGPEMIAALDPQYAHLPVLFVTGFAGEMMEHEAFRGRQVLRKPFTLAALERAIATTLRGVGPVGEDQVAAE